MKFTTENVRKLHERGFVSEEFLNNMEQMKEVLKEEEQMQTDTSLLASDEKEQSDDMER